MLGWAGLGWVIERACAGSILYSTAWEAGSQTNELGTEGIGFQGKISGRAKNR